MLAFDYFFWISSDTFWNVLLRKTVFSAWNFRSRKFFLLIFPVNLAMNLFCPVNLVMDLFCPVNLAIDLSFPYDGFKFYRYIKMFILTVP